MTERDTPPDPSRRGFLRGTAASAGGLAASFRAGDAAAQAEPARPAAPGDAVEVTFTLNGAPITRAVDPRRTLLDLLREGEGLTGTKVGCRHGQCGACTCHVDGAPHLACLTLAAQVDGREVTTIEGLARAAEAEGIATEDGLHPLQAAFVEHDGFQYGYCTPGQIMSAVALVGEGMAGDAQSVRMGMTGNICRCSAHPGIVAAILDGARAMEGSDG